MTQTTINYLMGGGLIALSVGLSGLYHIITADKTKEVCRPAVRSFLSELKPGQVSLLMLSVSHGHNFHSDFLGALTDSQKFQYSSLLIMTGSDNLASYYTDICKRNAEVTRGL